MSWLDKINPIYFYRMKSKKPWARFTFNGLIEEGIVPIEFDYNESFINHLREIGFSGLNEEELVRYFLISLIMPKVMEDEIKSDAHPNLTEEMNELRR